jgi:hypothetical protein
MLQFKNHITDDLIGKMANNCLIEGIKMRQWLL